MSQIAVIFVIIFINMLGFGIIIPLAPTFQSTFNLTAFEYGILGAIFPLAQGLAAPILGRLSDKYGRRPIILISFAFASISYLILAFATSFPILIVSRIIGGVFSASFAVAMACAADISTKENRVKYMGFAGMAFGFGFILGPTLGALFAGRTVGEANVLNTALFAFSISILGLLLTIKALPETIPQKYHAKTWILQELTHIIKKAEDAVNFSLNGILSMVLAGLEIFLSLWIAKDFNFDPFSIGIFWTLFALVMNIGRVAFINVIRGDLGITIAFSIIAFSALGYFLTSSLFWIYTWTYTTAMVAGVLISLINGRISLNADPLQQGLFLGLGNSVGNFGRMLGPYLMGYFIHIFNDDIHIGWLFLCIMAFIASGLAFTLYIKHRKELFHK